MKVQKSFLVPTDQLVARPDIIQQYIEAAAAAGVKALQDHGVAVNGRIVVREADPIIDFGMAAGGWNTLALAVAGTSYSCMTLAAAAITPALANNRVAVFYKISVGTPLMPVRNVQFREGAGGGTTKAVIALDNLISCPTSEGYLVEPVVYEPQQVLNIVAEARTATAAVCNVNLGCLIIEPAGAVVS